uniref:SusC/RagA family TonB-linked outer membrane protein n=1 Tax=Pedobacter schmidteae TaxID=2201271 RepID=UPI0013CE746A|nr:SusC/RagA family TonB-linked outer membrane protein [Pedobacter schmidteae]
METKSKKKTKLVLVMTVLCLIFSTIMVSAQSTNTATITGKVISASNGDGIPGATIKATATSQTTISNDKGTFTLSLPEGTSILSIQHLGYQAKTLNVQVPLNDKLIIALDADDRHLKEIEINAGYYTVKDKERTGAISRVGKETISRQPVSNSLAALIGRMPGVNIEQNSGVSGGGFTVEIRGRNSLRPEARNPMYLVDGVPYPSGEVNSAAIGVSSMGTSSPLNYLNPADIESIEILKDADATAIYGSRGANGVVLIKTKRPAADKTALDIDFNTGISKVGSEMKLLNTSQYLEMRNEAFKNDGAVPGATAYDVNGTWDQQRYTNWQKVLIGGTARSTNLRAGINGGNAFSQFSFSGNYSKNTTVFPDDFADQKISGTLGVNHTSVNHKFKVNFSASYLLNVNSLPREDLTKYILLAPNAPALFDSNGKLNWALTPAGSASWTNPLAATRQNYTGRSNNFLSSAMLNYELLKGLSIRSSLGYTHINLREQLLNSVDAVVPSPTATGSNTSHNNTIETWIIEPQLNYQRQIAKGKLDVLLGSTFQSDAQRAVIIAATGYINDALLESITAAPTRTAGSNASQYKYSALFGRINYAWDGKYFINLTARRDGSSRFGPDKQFANFGALGLAWIFTENDLIKKHLSWLSFGKLRSSYGITGSDQIPNYGYLDTYSSTQSYQGGTALYPTRLANPDYSWESNKKLETAMDLGFLKDKLFLSAAWYRNRSANQLVGYSLPDITGFTSVQYNLPATVQNSGWEFELNTVNIKTLYFSWKTSFNLTIPQNKLLAYPDIAASSYANKYTVGESLYTPKGLQFTGMDPKTGVYTFKDLNGNGSDLDQADQVSASKSLTSHAFGGLQNSFSYKNFQLDVFVQFADKTVRLPDFAIPGMAGNQPVTVMDRWRNEGDVKPIQKFTQSFIPNGAAFKYSYLTAASDQFADASFIRLKNVALSWNVPFAWSSRLKINGLRLYLQAQNLFTVTNYISDPEVSSIFSLPSLRSLTAGITMSL